MAYLEINQSLNHPLFWRDGAGKPNLVGSCSLIVGRNKDVSSKTQVATLLQAIRPSNNSKGACMQKELAPNGEAPLLIPSDSDFGKALLAKD
jgi:hypothetical protein